MPAQPANMIAGSFARSERRLEARRRDAGRFVPVTRCRVATFRSVASWPQCACFAVDGGQRSRLFLQAQGWAESRVLVVEDAICLHMNPHVPLGVGIEAHLLQQAAALDVIGARMATIDPVSRLAVLARYPRMGFTQQMSEAMRQQAERAPRTRTRLLWRMGFERAIRRPAWRE